MGNYNANFKRIRNLGDATDDYDAVRKAYVDTLALYGQAASDPQSWTVLGNEFSGVTGDITYTLGDPTPFSTNDDLFIVSLDGYIQRPGVDFTITETLGIYSLTLKMGSATIASDAIVNVQNFGVSRNVYEQPFLMNDPTSPALTARAVADATAPVLDIENSSGTTVGSIGAAGEITSSTLTATGNATIGGDATVTGTVTSGTLTATTVNATDLNVTNDLDVTDDLTVGGDATITGSVTSSAGMVASGNYTATGGQFRATNTNDDSQFKIFKNTGYAQLVVTDDAGFEVKKNDSTILNRQYANGQLRIYNPSDSSDFIYNNPANAGTGSVALGVYSNGAAKAYMTGNGRIIKTQAQGSGTDVLNRNESHAFYARKDLGTSNSGTGAMNQTTPFTAINNLTQSHTYLYIIFGGYSNGPAAVVGAGIATPPNMSYYQGYTYYSYVFIRVS